MDDLKTLCYIHEQTSFEDDYGGNFGYSVTDRGNRFFVEFEAVLQSFGDLNRNRRMYDQANIMTLIRTDEYIQDMLRKNSWMGEMDHPAPKIQDQELTVNRIGNPHMGHTSHYIRKPHEEGNLLVAHIQTDSGTKDGMNMAIKIVDGKIIPCFSARVFGSLDKKSGRPIVNVRKLITYDWVLFPSHKLAEAKIKQPVMEAAETLAEQAQTTVIFLPQLAQMAANTKETEWLCESFGLSIDDLVGVTESGNSVVLDNGQDAYIQPITDRQVRSRTQSFLRDWMHK